MDKKQEGQQATLAADLAAREKMLDNRTVWINAHDAAVAKRDSAISDREELVRLKEAELEARREADTARAERERLLVQIREVNQKLVLASLRAHELAEDAIAARAAADENAERFRSLVQTSSALVWRATADGRIEVDRDAWRKLTGAYPVEEEWGWLEAVHPLERARVRNAWEEAVATAKPYARQHRIRSRKGGYTWVNARAVPILKSGAVHEWIGMMSDVTDRLRVEEARDQFIAILGHDLRNPLASIVAGVEILRGIPEPFAKTVARVARSAHRIDSIIRDLLDFALGRLGGGIPITPRRCDMRLICSDVVEETKQANPLRDLRFEGVGDLRGEWDPDRIEQVLSNLVGNAVMHGEGPITVTSHREQERVVTGVHNQGPPIPDVLVPTLFEPFTRAEQDIPGYHRRHEGLGLGLYIASEIVHAHAGTLTVSSLAGEGTTFTFTLPTSVPRRARTTTGEEPIVRA
jgi:PAS domain S-box-containing protein